MVRFLIRAAIFLVTAALGLLIASLFPGGIRIEGAVTWVLATLVVWIVTALGGWVLPLLFLRKRANDRVSA